MIKKLIKIIFIIILIILTMFVVKTIRLNRHKNLIIRKADSLKGKEYKISGKIKSFEKGKKKPKEQNAGNKGYKLIYEMNFECGVCLMKLKTIYDFYVELSEISKIKFYIVSLENSDSYIRYYLDKTLDKYALYFIEQEPLNYETDLYLLDENNKIVFSGDIFEYSFLKKEYIKRLKKIIKKNKNSQNS